jgi:hypothetical protein
LKPSACRKLQKTIEAGLTSLGELAAKAMRGQSGIPLVELEIAPELAITVLHPTGIDRAVSGRRGRDPGRQGGTQRFQVRGHRRVFPCDIMVAAIVLGYPVVEADRFYRHIRLVGQPVALSRTPSKKMAARPPEFGEQTDAVLAEFGFSADEITELKLGKVI